MKLIICDFIAGPNFFSLLDTVMNLYQIAECKKDNSVFLNALIIKICVQSIIILLLGIEMYYETLYCVLITLDMWSAGMVILS